MSGRGRKSCIYALSDPTTGAVRYVGQTVDPRRREWLHCSPSNNKGGRRVNLWIRRLLASGQKPVFRVVEGTDSLDEREQHWIAHFREAGCDLLNMNAGGTDNEHMLSAPKGNRGKRMPRAHWLKIQLRSGIEFAREVGKPGLEARLRFALEYAEARGV